MLKITKGNKKPFKPDLAPLIDVVFLLLIFYMLTFAVSGQGLSVKLPPESSSNAKEEIALTIKINGIEDIRVGGKITTLAKLESMLKAEIVGRKNKAVVVETNSVVKYDIFVRVFDLARQAGAKNFSLVI
ncbi:MAG: biopolymer transport protein ExbD [Nitrospinales bacterium]|jgi:biopolymer transport protein ExbD